MSHAAKRRLCWLIAAGLTAALFAAAFLWLEVRYDTNDDAGFVRAFLGYETGQPARFSIFLHGLLTLPLAALSEAFPGVAWFSWIQLALLALACVVSLKSAMQCMVNAGRPLWAGVGLALVYLGGFAFCHCVRINFTQTAALLGAAAVWQLMSIDWARAGGKAVFGGVALAGVLLALAYALRQITALPLAAFCLLALAYALVTDGRRRWRPLLAGLAAVAVLFAGLAGWRSAEIAHSGAQEYLAWQEANEPVIDNYGMDSVPPEAFAAVGWSENTVSLVAEDWFFLDESINAEAFNTLTQSVRDTMDVSLSARLNAGWQEARRLWEAEPGFRLSLGVLAAAALLCAVLLALQRRGGWTGAALLLAWLGLAGVAFLLAVGKGRMPLRALLMGYLPCAAMTLALLARALGGARRRVPCALTLAALLALTGVCLAREVPPLAAREDDEDINTFADLCEYALDNEDMFIIHDMTLANQYELFPDTEWGVPHNVSCWGGWALRSPESVAQFENYGIDLWHFPPETFLRDDVLLATGVVDPPPNKLLTYLREKVDPNVECMLYGEYGYVFLFQFYLP